MNRRQFAKSTLLTSAAVSLNPLKGLSGLSPLQTGDFRKGIMWGTLRAGKTILEKFQAAAKAGFDGIEIYSHLDRKEVLQAKEATGLAIPSLCGALHWKFLLSDPDPAVRAKGSDALKVSLEDAHAYGADTVLLVPGVVNQNVKYNECWDRTVEEIQKLIPLARSLNVRIAIENVWNNFLLSPLEAAYYVDQFESPSVGFYLDCGNILVYGWPEQWIEILGKRLAKVHIKEFSLKKANTEGKSQGFNVKLREGEVNWPAVIAALKNAGYNSWLTLEQSGGDTQEGLKDLCDRLKIIIQG